VVRSTPHQSYVPMQTFSAVPFSLDGLPLEYKKQGNPTSAPQFDAADPAADPNPLWLFATSSALHVYWRFHAQSPGVMGEEQGDIYVLIDNKRAMTLQRVAECNGQGVQYQHPAKTDRFIAFSYALSSSQQEGSVAPASITQLKGDCNGGWAPLAGGDLVANLSAYLYDSGDETLGLEMVLDFYGAMASDQLLGLGLRRDVGGAPREALPFFEDDGVVPPDSTDAHSWETLRLFEVAGLGAEPTEREDGCCFAPLDDLD
jgi:hypothetical protein